MVEIGWDHASGQVKVLVKRGDVENFIIINVHNSVEVEAGLRDRFAANKGVRAPATSYVSMFAGATKPKPFQRKRPNLTKLPAGKLPPLAQMRNIALDLHKGSYAPCPAGNSRRLDLATQHIFDGYNTFPVTYVKGQASLANQWRLESLLLVTENMMVFRPTGIQGPSVEIAFDDIETWQTVDNETVRKNDSGIDVFRKTGEHHYFGTPHIRDLKHSLEYFWNKYQIMIGGTCVPGSTHGRPLETVHTLSGEVKATESVMGSSEIVDSDGTIIRAGARTGAIVKRASLTGTVETPKTIPPVNHRVKSHWDKVVVHQGWLLKQGGIGIGAHKDWLKRYFVLYGTSQGHFLTYYSDFTECPLYTSENHGRNVIDLAKTTFIRPGSTKTADTPAHSFDIVTTEREWTLCAEGQENMQKWLSLLTRGVDEDVAILPDEIVEFKVKAKVDPLGVFNPVDYSTTLNVSANGVAVTTPESPGSAVEKQVAFWVYTDFYKWSLLSQNGKLALLVNVFADSSFSKRHEFVFRSKDAVRLASAIEFFIEKFMSVMHVRLEGGEVAAAETVDNSGGAGQSTSMVQASADDWQPDQVNAAAPEVDLLDMGFDSAPAAPAASGDDFLSGAGFSAPAAPANDGFGADPFAPPPAPAAPVTQTKVAAPFTPEQEAQHRAWLQASLLSGGGPLYDDGILQIATKMEVSGYAGKLTLFIRNRGSSAATNLSCALKDTSGLVRITDTSGSLASSLAPGAQGQQVFSFECVKPAAPGPELSLSYENSGLGNRTELVRVPIAVTTFNEQYPLSGPDFSSRWGKLTGPGQEAVEVFYPSNPINASQIHQALTSVCTYLFPSVLF